MAEQDQKEELIHAELVYDGGTELHLPSRLGAPGENQFKGNVREQVAELAGRVCYDSLGAKQSRSSAAYHAHIREVGHLSVYEHTPVTVAIDLAYESDRLGLLLSLINRPGVFVWYTPSDLRVTLNLRALLDFGKFRGNGYESVSQAALRHMRVGLTSAIYPLAPTVLERQPRDDSWLKQFRVVEPMCDAERWVTLFVSGSRGMSHEFVRHGDFTAISQRSTRYVNEDESPWVEHPLRSAWATHSADSEAEAYCADLGIVEDTDAMVRDAKRVYSTTVTELERWITARGADKFTARKQARGAARGYLGNALYTELIFSASMTQWNWMLENRCTDQADAEIRLVFAKVLTALQGSRYAHSVDDLTLVPARDGIGSVLAERASCRYTA